MGRILRIDKSGSLKSDTPQNGCPVKSPRDYHEIQAKFLSYHPSHSWITLNECEPDGNIRSSSLPLHSRGAVILSMHVMHKPEILVAAFELKPAYESKGSQNIFHTLLLPLFHRHISRKTLLHIGQPQGSQYRPVLRHPHPTRARELGQIVAHLFPRIVTSEFRGHFHQF